MRVIVTGSRDWGNPNAARHAIGNRLFRFPSDTLIVTGYNPTRDTPAGVDRFAYQEAQKLGLAVQCYPAQWEVHDREGSSGVKCYCPQEAATCKAAGFRRNQQMIESAADLVLAFWNGISSGTRDTMMRAEKAGIPIEQIEVPKL